MSKDAIPARVRWALSVLDPGPTDRVLEIGCGPGVAAQLVCERLSTGRLLAIDRSEVAIARTTRRNQAAIDAGRLEARACTLDQLVVPAGSLDAAFAVNVNVFWTRSAATELAILATALRAGGALHLCYDGGPQDENRVTGTIGDALTGHEFTDLRVRRGEGGFAVSAVTQPRP